MKSLKGIKKNSGLTYALKYAAGVLKQGIGISKREVYRKFGGRSPLIHSYSTFNRYMGIVKQFVNWARERGVNRLDKVIPEVVREFLLSKAGYCSQKTLKVNASALRKFFEVVGRPDISEEIGRSYQEIYSEGRQSGRALAFAHPERVISNLKEEVHRVIAELQLLTGARVGDVKKMELLPLEKKVVIKKSKGGRTREIDYSDRPEEFERIREFHGRLKELLREKDWNSVRKSYYSDLKRAVVKAGEVYTGSHAFRVNYVKNRLQELKSQGYSEDEALQKIEYEIGHSRIEMSAYYAGG
ncbi:site-specific integrase [Thermovibrio guaymasensis]|nr:site-specific integrase [Thermovibrio guaymasensis]